MTIGREKCGKIDCWVTSPKIPVSGGTIGDLDSFVLLFFFFNFLSSKMAIYYVRIFVIQTKHLTLSRLLFATDTTLGVGKVYPLAVLGVPPLTRLGLTSMPAASVGADRDLCAWGGCHVLALCPTCSRSQRVPRSC